MPHQRGEELVAGLRLDALDDRAQRRVLGEEAAAGLLDRSRRCSAGSLRDGSHTIAGAVARVEAVRG